MIYDLIRQLVEYGLDCGLVQPEDTIYTANRLFALFKLDGDDAAIPAHTGQEPPRGHQLEPLLAALLDWAYDHGLLEGNSVDYRDIFDTAIMGCLTPPPSQVNATFKALYQKSPQAATDWFYEFSQNSDYIRRYRIQRDMKWTVATEYGELDITINLSKPEKDPKAIAAAKLQPQGGYPKCQLCVENEGYSGRLNHPARSSHRIIPVTIQGQEWGFQYSPYVYYNEHCILLNKSHVPMEINKAAFGKLFDFVRQFPHYMVGSNADLPIVGGSILSHEHFQGGNYTFPMARATVETSFQMSRFPQVEAGILKWPMSVIRLRHQDYNVLVEAADFVLTRWRDYSDPVAGIVAHTGTTPHNTITPIVRFREGAYEIDLALRNNITTQEHPLGVFHPHAELHHIKKENIGLIEVMGLAILPARLKTELELLADFIVMHRDAVENWDTAVSALDASARESISKHLFWAKSFASKCTRENVHEVLQQEVGLVFSQVLSHAGVFKRTPEGSNAFARFTSSLNA